MLDKILSFKTFLVASLFSFARQLVHLLLSLSVLGVLYVGGRVFGVLQGDILAAVLADSMKKG